MLKNLMKKKNKSKGFTLIELIIVIAIIAILAAIAVPKYLQVKEDANKKSDVSNARQVEEAVILLYGNGDISPDTTKTSEVVSTDTNGGKEVYNYLNKSDLKVKAKTDNGSTLSFQLNADGSVSVFPTGHAGDEIAPNPSTGWK